MQPIKINDQKSGPAPTNKKAKLAHIKLFRRLNSQPDNECPLEKALLILCTPRSGSTFFSESLNACGKLGFCDEWFNYDYFDAWAQVTSLPFNLQQYIDWVAKKTLRNTGVFTLKCHVGQFVAMNQDHKLGIETMDFTHVVHIYRKDKIAQAVSLVKAAATGKFRSCDVATGEYQMSRASIAEALANIIKFEQFLASYLKKYIDASVAYEDFWASPDLDCNEVLSALGKAPCHPADFNVTTIKKQADKRNFDAASDFRLHLTGEIE